MKIIIYDKNTTKGNFTNYGYGKLKLVKKCEITEELNGRYDVELIIDMNDSKSSYLTKWTILSIDGQLFRIINIINNDKENTIKIYAKHIFYDLSYGFVEDKRAEGRTMQEAMQIALPDDFATTYEVSSDIETLNTLYFVKNSGTENIFSLIERWGMGELSRDNFNISINKNKGSDNGVTFTYKKIDAIEITEDVDEVITRLYPTGKDGLTLKEKYIYIPNWSKDDYLPFHITREVKFDDVDNEGTLRELAKQEAATLGISRINFKIDVHNLVNTELYKHVPQLLSCEIGDIVTIKHPKLNIRAKVKVIKKVVEKTTGNVTLELGQPFKNFFDSIDNGKVTVPAPDLSDYKEKMFYYSNGVAINNLSEVFQSIAFINYGVNIRTNLTLYVNVFIECEAAGKATLKFIVDNEVLEFQPSVNLEPGSRIISFTYPLISVKENVNHSMNVMLSMGEGAAYIAKNNIQIMIKGQGVSGGLSGERPHAEVSETVDFKHTTHKDINRTSDVNITHITPGRTDDTEHINFKPIGELNKDIINESVDVLLTSTGYIRTMLDVSLIYNKDIIDITNGTMTINNVERIVEGKVSNLQLEEGTLHEITLADRTTWSSIEEGGIYNG